MSFGCGRGPAFSQTARRRCAGGEGIQGGSYELEAHSKSMNQHDATQIQTIKLQDFQTLLRSSMALSPRGWLSTPRYREF